MKVKVFAKLNLSLNVGQRQGEYHPIDSVVTSVDVCDVVTVTLRHDETITLSCSADIPTLQNSAYRAAVEFQKEFATRGCSIDIVKGIPIGAGMGGSSADAAAVVYCLCALNNVDLSDGRVKALCARIGSDVNFMLHGGIARMRGKGDDLEFLPYSKMFFALTTFNEAMFSRDVFATFDEVGLQITCDNDQMVEYLARGDTGAVFSMCANGLQPAVRVISSYAEKYLRFCAGQGIFPIMTGSGSAYFVPCRSHEEAAALSRTLSDNGFPTTACQSVARGVESI